MKGEDLECVHYCYCLSPHLPSFLSSTAYSHIWKPLHWSMLYPISWTQVSIVQVQGNDSHSAFAVACFTKSFEYSLIGLYSSVCSECCSHQPSFCGSNNGYRFLLLVK
jgi:hypothetical protein